MINDMLIDDSLCSRTEPARMYPSMMGQQINNRPIGYSQKITLKTGGIYIDQINSKPGR